MPSELAMRIAAACEQEASTAMPYFDKIVDEHIAPLQAENERLKSIECACGDSLTEGASCVNCVASVWSALEGMKEGVGIRISDLESDNAALRQQVAELRSLLKELQTMVWGECPSLLDEDSGGSAYLDAAIDAALKEPSRDA